VSRLITSAYTTALKEGITAKFLSEGEAFMDDFSKSFNLRDILRARLKDAGHDYDDSIIEIAAIIAKELADREYAARQNALNAEWEKRTVLLAQFMDLVRPLVTNLEMGPYDELVSIAIKEADGQIRVVQLGNKDGS
jgi:hypothetical protein